jgi:ATP-dependent DNA helicase 2 subunit 1
MTDDTARAVDKTELRKAYKFGGETVQFPPEQLKLIRQCFGEPVIRIIGFKPLSMLPIWANTKTPTFIYPSESDYIGSTRVFSALQQKLIKDKKMALVWYIARKNAGPVIAALVSGVERLSDDDEQIMPPGMWLIPLPFVDDIRDYPDASLEKTTDDLTDMMREVMQMLQLPKAIYDPSRYPNPCKPLDRWSLASIKYTDRGYQRCNGFTGSSKPWRLMKRFLRNRRIRLYPNIGRSTR